MEPHVKERIVGAAVLVALGVWLIPWVLDGPETVVEDAGPAAGIALPSIDEVAAIRTETVELVPTERAGEPDREERATETAAVAVATLEPVAPAVEDSTDGSLPEPDPAPAPPQAAPVVATEAPPDRSGWLVQVGAFSDAANAEQVARRVSTFGFDAYVSDFRSSTGTLHRVRVGGFASENEADAAASSLSAHDFAVRVIPPE